MVVHDEAGHEVVEVAAAQVDALHVPHQDLLGHLGRAVQDHPLHLVPVDLLQLGQELDGLGSAGLW